MRSPRISIKDAILEILIGLMAHFKKQYCFPTQATLLNHLETDHGWVISRRTLNRYLDDMEASGDIKRARRHKLVAKLGWCFRSTLYKLGSSAPWAIGKLKRLCKRFAAVLRVPQLAQYPKDVIITKQDRPASIGSILEVLRI